VSIAIKQADEIEKLLCHKVGLSKIFGHKNYFGLFVDFWMAASCGCELFSLPLDTRIG
jgi:hypothetical protein